VPGGEERQRVSRPRIPEPDSLAVGILLARELALEPILEALTAEFCAPVAVSPEIPFPETGYYEREMGPGIRRRYAGLGGSWSPGGLASVKLRTNTIEERWRLGGNRRVNLDPGMLNLHQLVLATGKPAAHRVYLAEGIYAEVEYVFEHGSFRPLPWTYADYREPASLEFFGRLRQAHKAARKGLR
jgi:hypothetical protein